MKVALLSTSDITGGAAVVTQRLTEALRAAGVDATMVAAHISGSYPGKNPPVVAAGWPVRYRLDFLAERLQIFLSNGLNRRHLFQADTARFGLPLDRHPVVREADVVVVAWVNQAMLSLDALQRIARQKPVVVVMHDMWWLTGICHHAGECTRYRGGCGKCPLLGHRSAPRDLSLRTWLRKKAVYSDGSLQFVAVSGWLADKCAESSLLGDMPVEVIPNAFPVEQFATGEIIPRSQLGLPDDESTPIVLMGAARLDDPIKGLPQAVEALNHLHSQGRRFFPVFFGNLRDEHALDALTMPFKWLGPIADPAAVRSLYRHSTVVVLSSAYETLPTTLIEGQAAGCWPASFDRGGQRDIVSPGRNGSLAPWPDARQLAAGIAQGIDRLAADPSLAGRLTESVARRFSSQAIAARYIELFNRLLSRKVMKN